MKTAEWIQLDGVRRYIKDMVYSDSVLHAQLGVEPQRIVARVVPHRLFTQLAADSVNIMVTEMPVIGVFPIRMPHENVQGFPGFQVSLGLQYLYQAHVGTRNADGDDHFSAESVATHLIHFLWYRICKYLQQPIAMMEQYKIADLYCEYADSIPIMETGITGFDGFAYMDYRLPPYRVADHSVPLNQVHGTYPVDGIPADEDYQPGVTDVSS